MPDEESVAIQINGKFPCMVCGKIYSRKHHLFRHTRTHAQDAWGRQHHYCRYCHKAFVRSDVCGKHAKNCPKRGPDDELLTSSTRGRRPVACKACHFSKSACDKRRPCSRCKFRHIDCCYRESSGFATTRPYDVPFLLQLCDPSAETMLDAFSHDSTDADVNDAAAMATINWGQAMPQEDDILIWTLGSVLDLDGLGLCPSKANGIAYPPHVMAELAPIFRPAAFKTLEAKINSATSELYVLHGQLLAHDASYNENFDLNAVKAALSPRATIMFSVVFFQMSHRYISLVHRPSFGSEDTTAVLLLAVAFAGSTRSSPTDDVICVRGLARILEEFIFLRLEQLMRDATIARRRGEALETLEAAILVFLIQFMAVSTMTRQRMRDTRLPTLVSAVRRLDLFTVTHRTDSDWLQFIQAESCIRIAHWVAMADWLQASIYHMPPHISIREMAGEMPCSLELWNAPTTTEYLTLRQSQKSRRRPYSVRDCIQTLMQDPGSLAKNSGASNVFSMSDLMIIILGLALTSIAISSELSQSTRHVAPALLNALRQWQDLWENTVRAADTRAMKSSGVERYSNEYALIARNIVEVALSCRTRPPYLERIGHDTLSEFYAFLVQCYK